MIWAAENIPGWRKNMHDVSKNKKKQGILCKSKQNLTYQAYNLGRERAGMRLDWQESGSTQGGRRAGRRTAQLPCLGITGSGAASEMNEVKTRECCKSWRRDGCRRTDSHIERFKAIGRTKGRGKGQTERGVNKHWARGLCPRKGTKQAVQAESRDRMFS